MESLTRTKNFNGPKGPVVLVIMDGIGIDKYKEGDIVQKASTPTLAWLSKHALFSQLRAHGTCVGLPSNHDMGNSEVGHNAIGCDRVLEQGASLVNHSIQTGTLFKGKVWMELIENVKQHDSRLHFIGLLSDGNVHSHINHLEALLAQAKAEGVKEASIHILLDGRDVPSTSALDYVERLESFLTRLSGNEDLDYAVASGGGRMKITMDRYEANWKMVELGWKTHVRGEGRKFGSAREAIETFRNEYKGRPKNVTG